MTFYSSSPFSSASSFSSSLFPSSSVSFSSFFSSSTKCIHSCFGEKWTIKLAVVAIVVTSGTFSFVVLRRYKHLPLHFSSFFSLPSYNTKKLLPPPPSISSSSLPSVSSNMSSSSSSISSPVASAILGLPSSLLSSPVAAALAAISSSSSSGFWGLVGNTPTVQLEGLSRDTDCRVLGKCEFLNPGGSVKDRVARAIIQLAEAEEKLKPGSTGISLAMAAKARGYQCCIYMPDDQAKEKSDLLKRLGAKVIFKKPVSIINSDHFCNAARRDASDISLKGKGYYADQFENPANFLAHYLGTGEEIWRDTKGSVTAFVSAAGTGGTISGTAARLKTYNPNIKVILADPQGSALFGRVKHGVLYTKEDAEGHRTRHIFDTVTEGIGLNRLTRNFELGCDLVDDSFKVSDLEAVEMAHYLIEKEGLFLGSSSAVNCCGLVKAVKAGMRHLSKFYNIKYLRSLHILPSYLDVPENENNEDLEDERDNETTTLNDNDDKKIIYSSPETSSDIQNKAAHRFVKPQSVWEFIQ